MRKKRRRETLKQLEARWYKRLKDEGFRDIEDTNRPERPLKEWHSYKFGGRRWNGRGSAYDPTHIPATQEYYRLATLFLAEYPFGGLGILGRRMEMKILSLHAQGTSIRKIADELEIHYLQVYKIICAMRERFLGGSE